MANIRIDADGLQNNISSMRAYINELDSLNARTQTLMTQIASSWEGEASTAYINIMTERIQKAGQMKELLQEFISYMESTRTKFVSRDQELLIMEAPGSRRKKIMILYQLTALKVWRKH